MDQLNILIQKKIRKQKMRAQKIRGSQMGESMRKNLNIPSLKIEKDTSKKSLLKYPSAEKSSVKLIPEVKDVPKSNDPKKMEPVKLPEKDPYPVKTGHHFLIETSFEEKDSVHSDEELIGYQLPKDTIEGKMHYAAKRIQRFNWKELKNIKIKSNQPEDNFVSEIRRACKQDQLKRIRSMTLKNFRNSMNSDTTNVTNIVKLFKLKGGEMLDSSKTMKRPKKKSVDMSYISKLHDQDCINQFYKRGIVEQNFIGMVNDCKNDIKTFKKISFLPSSMVHKSSKAKDQPFDGKSPWYKRGIVSSSHSTSTRKTSAMSIRPYSSERIDTLIKKYCTSGGTSRRNIEVANLTERKRQKLEIQVCYCFSTNELPLFIEESNADPTDSKETKYEEPVNSKIMYFNVTIV